jgi:hypothetical protein
MSENPLSRGRQKRIYPPQASLRIHFPCPGLLPLPPRSQIEALRDAIESLQIAENLLVRPPPPLFFWTNGLWLASADLSCLQPRESVFVWQIHYRG